MSGYDLQPSSPQPVHQPPMPPPQSPPPPPPPSRPRRWLFRLLFLALLISIGVNVYLQYKYESYFANSEGPAEYFVSGSDTADEKIAIVKVHGVIMGRTTESALNQIQKAQDDPDVIGVLLSVDSPGGTVADSHEIYHRLADLRKEKPIVVQMKSMAASGGLYIAMGAGEEGKIFAEPTTWTGSIGVIIPRMEMLGLADKIGVESKPIKTGPFKDALSPFRTLDEKEKAVWDNIIDQAFNRFVGVIAENRADLDTAAVRKLATGEVYTADDALNNKLIDRIGYREDALADLLARVDREEGEVRVVSYESPTTLIDIVLGSARAQQPEQQWQLAIESTVPRPMYCCSWLAGLTSGFFRED